jgi:hypothetical protein
MNILNPIEAVIPKARETRARSSHRGPQHALVLRVLGWSSARE